MTTDFDATDAAALFFAGATAAGLQRVLICPGSRSSPLAIGATRVAQLPYAVHLDERSAAFAALGEAKATGLPVAIVCTSGTAGVNFAPAIAEASMSNVPLLAITADRPPEHQRWGVGQSLDQRGLFGRHVRDEVTMPVGADGGPDHSERAGWRAVATSLESGGPVHVNWPFRLPLEPSTPPQRVASALPRCSQSRERHIDEDLERFTTAMKHAAAPVIIAGPDTVGFGESDVAKAILKGANALGIPVLADVLSGLRGHGPTVQHPGLTTTATSLNADLVIHLGNTPTAKSIRLWWEDIIHARHILVDPKNDWQDPSHRFDERLISDPAWLLTSAASRAARPSTASAAEHLATWAQRGDAIDALVHQALDASGELTEAHIAAAVGRWAATSDADRTVVTSSSMPIRDLDMFAPAHQPIAAISNRGVNGIDGVIATSIGVWRARGHRVVTLIGDVAALHDLGSVLDAVRQGCELTIVIPNNDGGGIFSHLPMRDAIEDSLFDELFHTPHGTDFSFLDGVDGLTYRQFGATDELTDLLNGPQVDGVLVLEGHVDTTVRLQLRETIEGLVQDL